MVTLLSQTTPRTVIGALTLSLLFLELLIGGVLLPYRQAQAVVDIIGGPSNILALVEDFVADAYDWASSAYESAGTWVSAAKDIWDKTEYIAKEAIKFAWNRLRRVLLNMLVNDIINWINGGGKPRFVTDWQSFLKTAADKAAGSFIDKIGLGFLCTGFSLQLRIALSSPTKFDEGGATCTLSKAFTNINSFRDNFSNGGWKGWLTVSESQNNYMGAYITALNKKHAVMAEAAGAKKNEAVSSAGFMGDKICRTIRNKSEYRDPDSDSYETQTYGSTDGWKEGEIPEGYECEEWETRTPGRIVGDSLQQAVGIDIPWIISAKEFAEYAGAIVDAVINRAIKEGITKMTSTSEGTSSGYGVSGSSTVPGINAPASVTVNVSSYDDANNNGTAAKALDEQQKLLKQNTERLIAEKQTDLGILNTIKTSQQNSLTALKNHLPNCPLPSGVSLTTIAGTTQVISTCNASSCPCTATTVENVKLSASGVGESILEKTTTQTYEMDADDFGMGSCVLAQTAYSYRPLSTTVEVESKITALNSEIAALQNEEITKITTANTDTQNYLNSAINYMTAYEAWQKGNMAAATSTAETAMKTAKQTAIASNQALLSLSSDSFNEFTQATMKKSNETTKAFGEVMTKRGGVTDCAYTQPGLYQYRCSVQATEASYQSSLNTCLSPSI